MCMGELRQTFIENLKHYRKERGFRQLDLALAIGKSSNYINSVENGKYFPSPETIEQIAAALDLEPICLFESGFEKSMAIPQEELERKIKKVVSDGISRVFAELSKERQPPPQYS